MFNKQEDNCLAIRTIVLSLLKRFFNLGVVKQKLKSAKQDANNAPGQSEVEAITCDRRQARENARAQVTIGFDVVSHWLIKWRKSSQRITVQIK